MLTENIQVVLLLFGAELVTVLGLRTLPGVGVHDPAGFCVGIYVITSFMTPAMDPERVRLVCWDHPLAFLQGRVAGLSDPRRKAILPC